MRVFCSGKPPIPPANGRRRQSRPIQGCVAGTDGAYQRPPREDQTALIGLKSSAFPYLGNHPRTDEPFLNVSKVDRRGHRSYGGRVYWGRNLQR